MAIKKVRGVYIGLSTDHKPIPSQDSGTRIIVGTKFIETDTKKESIYINGHWYYTHNQSLASS